MSHPLLNFDPFVQRSLFWGATALSIAFMIVLFIQGGPLRTPVAPRGVLSLQFAFRMNRAQVMLDSWKDVKQIAYNQILIDFGFLIIYPVAISLACLAIYQTHAGNVRHTALILAWVVLAAGPLDLIENLASLRMLSRGATSLSAAIVSGAATIKFLAALPPLLFVIVVALADRK